MDASPPSLFNAFYKESPLASYKLQVTFAFGELQVKFQSTKPQLI